MRQDFKRSSNSLINKIINDKFGIEIGAFYLIFETLCVARPGTMQAYVE